MTIVDKDFKIECGEFYILSFLKSKKELKEDSEDSFKIGGYFNKLENAIKEVIKFRNGKKYPFKEVAEPLKKLVTYQRTSDVKLYNLFLSLDTPINEFSKDIIKKIKDGLD